MTQHIDLVTGSTGFKYFDVEPEDRPDLPLNLIGASDAPPVLGVDEYSTVHDVFGRCAYGIEAFRPEWLDEAGAWGREIELVTGVRWARAHPELQLRELVKPPTRIGPRPWQRYSIDFATALGKPAIVECKLLSERRFARENWGPDGSAEVPFRIVAQVHAQLDALRVDAEWCREHLSFDPFALDRVHVAVCVAGKQLVSYVVPFDPELGALIAERCEQLWTDFIVPKKCPPANATEGSLRALARIYPKAIAPVRDASANEAEIAREYVELKRALKAAEGRKLELENALAFAIGDARGIRGQGFADGVLWIPKRGLTRWKEVALELAEQLGLDASAIEALQQKHRGEPSRYFKVDLDEES